VGLWNHRRLSWWAAVGAGSLRGVAAFPRASGSPIWVIRRRSRWGFHCARPSGYRGVTGSLFSITDVLLTEYIPSWTGRGRGGFRLAYLVAHPGAEEPGASSTGARRGPAVFR